MALQNANLEKSITFLAIRQYGQAILEKITTLSFAIASVTNFIAIAVGFCVLWIPPMPICVCVVK